MEAIHIIIVLIIAYIIYDAAHRGENKPEKTKIKYIKESPCDQSNETVGRLHIAQQMEELGIAERNKKNRPILSDQFKKNHAQEMYIDPYLGELSDEPQSNGKDLPAYDIMDRDILTRIGRDTVQGLHVSKPGTNEMLWVSGGSV